MDSAITGPITGVVPLIHVADIERSAAFYRLLGFEIGNYQPRTGEKSWAWLYAPQVSDWRRGPNLMLTRGEEKPGEVRPGTTTLYLYAADVVAMHATLVANGVTPGAIAYPDYMPEGEFGVRDPDGYHLTIAQTGPETP
jgi:catechol 2,3-dioxygenase-like lactoylglutathione lyase family enzyme